jgi:peptide/nickel transport system substrate-binding protein
VALRLPLLVALATSACGAPPPPAVRTPALLAILAERDVEGLDPHTAGQVWQTQMVLANVYEGLIAFDARMSLTPALAVAWSNPDERTWDFELRPHVAFQTGGFVEADDVVFSFRRARDHPDSALRVALAGVEEVRALAPDRVRIRTREADAFLLARLREVFVVSRRYVEQHGEAALATTSCGTGPYQVAARTPGASVDLARFPGHWRGPAHIPQARFVARSFGAPDLAQLLPADTPLLFWARPGSPVWPLAQQQAVAHPAPGLAVLYLSFDLRPRAARPFMDARVRRAVAASIDRDALVRLAMAGEAIAASQLVPPTVLGFDPQLAPQRRDAAAAQRLMAESPAADGFDVDLNLRESQAALSGPLAQQLSAVGIRVHIHTWADEDFFHQAAAGALALAVHRFSCWTGDAQTFYDKVIHSRRPAVGYGIFNFAYDDDPEPGLDYDIEESRHLLNPNRRLLALQHIMRRILDAGLAIPLIQEKDLVFTSPQVVYTPRADTFRMLYEMDLRTEPQG